MSTTPHAPRTPGRTDLGRRLAGRRAELGLSRAELGRRCGADANYIAYLEEQPASPAFSTLLRIANALGTTVTDLAGGNADHAPGRTTARRDSALLKLSEEECRRLMGGHGVGRIAVCTAAGPEVLPVNYLFTGKDLAFRTATDALVVHAQPTRAAFEIDRIDDVMASGWSVLAVGALRSVDDPRELARLARAARSRPWAGGNRTHWMRLTPERISGRRVVHER